MTNPHHRPLQGALWMAASGLSFVGVYIGVKMVGTRLPAAESAFLRYVLGLVFLLPTLPAMRREGVTGRTLKLLGLRGAVHSVAVMLWFYAMTRLTVAEVSAMGYLTPVFVTLGAAVFFAERLALRRILAIAAALIGVIIILRPGLRPVDMGHIAMIATTMGFGISYLITKRASADASPVMIVGILSVTVTIGLAPMALPVWIAPTPNELVWLFFVAAAATSGHFCMTYAFRAAPLSVTQPVTFLQLVWSVAVGFLLFGEAIDFFVILGGTVIVLAVVYITLREARLKAAQ